MKWFINRLGEPSTWAGFAALIPSVLALIAGPVTPEAIGGLVGGAAAVLMKEKSSD